MESLVVTLPISGYQFRELSECELELTLPSCSPDVIETHGLGLEGLSRRYNKRSSIAVLYGALQDGLLPQVTGLTRKSGRSLSITLVRVGDSHWAAELEGAFNQVQVLYRDKLWTEELPPA